ncbi:class I and II aminotransferase [Nitratireductor indicus C115]|uniref:Class I and II aminotransferase n=1 Tax=Nitratireductor indicus C115 TaxID=1231190 RepID=K2P1G2_9HYPH|nr:class I and II aminotransferase [Nitratireductor indicus C115]
MGSADHARGRTVVGQFPELAHHHVTLQLRQIVDEQHAVEMVDFMLQAGRQKSVGLHRLHFSLDVHVIDRHTCRAFDIGIIIGNRQAAFLVDVARIRARHNLGIEHHQRCRFLVLVRNVDNEHAQRLAHLNGGEADPRRVIHRVEHVVGEFAQSLIHAFHRL